MPLEFREEAGGEVIALRASGKLRGRDLQRFTPEVDRLFRTHGPAHVLLEMLPGFRGWETSAAWEAVKLGLKHVSGIDRLALVGEPRRTHRLQRLCRWLTSAQVRSFDPEHADQARAWLRETADREPAAEG